MPSAMESLRAVRSRWRGEAVELEPMESWRAAWDVAAWPRGEAALPSAEISGTDPQAAHVLCELAERVCVLLLDGRRLAQWLALHESLPLCDDHPREAISVSLARGWADLFDDAPQRCDLEQLERDAAKNDFADLVIETAALRAMCALGEQRMQDAKSLARRASRMARVEGLPHSEYLSNIVLARVRRCDGAPHLAARIANALADVAPAPYRGWLAWELTMAGAHDLASTLSAKPGDSVSAQAARALLSMLHAPPSEFPARAQEVPRLLHCYFARHEAAQLTMAMDPHVPLREMEGALHEWCAGEVPVPPAALLGWCNADTSGRAPAYVTTSGGEPRRILGLGLSQVEPPMSMTGSRRDTALAVLLLGGRAGLTDEDFFLATYGFALTLNTHRSALHVLKHRLRAGLADGVELVRVGDRNILETKRPLTLPDPRCGRRTSDRILRTLAKNRASAKEVASALDIAVRTAQKILQELVDDGSCVVRKDGRQVTYSVEDTTFSEPTRY